jgi:hypothetical protein
MAFRNSLISSIHLTLSGEDFIMFINRTGVEMKIIWDILIQSSEYFTVLAGALGVILFLCMILSLDGLRGMGGLFNRSYSVKNVQNEINRKRDIEKMFYDNSRFFGLAIILASAWVLFFLFKQLDINKIIAIMKVRSNLQPFTLALLQTAKLFSVLSVVFAFIFGLVLIFDRSSAERLSVFFSSWYSTEGLEDKLDETVLKDTDTICFLHNKFIGLLGFLASAILVLLAVMNLNK